MFLCYPPNKVKNQKFIFIFVVGMERNKIEEIFFNCGRQDEMERRQNENSRTSSPKARVLQDEDKFPFRQWR